MEARIWWNFSDNSRPTGQGVFSSETVVNIWWILKKNNPTLGHAGKGFPTCLLLQHVSTNFPWVVPAEMKQKKSKPEAFRPRSPRTMENYWTCMGKIWWYTKSLTIWEKIKCVTEISSCSWFTWSTPPPTVKNLWNHKRFCLFSNHVHWFFLQKNGVSAYRRAARCWSRYPDTSHRSLDFGNGSILQPFFTGPLHMFGGYIYIYIPGFPTCPNPKKYAPNWSIQIQINLGFKMVWMFKHPP